MFWFMFFNWFMDDSCPLINTNETTINFFMEKNWKENRRNILDLWKESFDL